MPIRSFRMVFQANPSVCRQSCTGRCSRDAVVPLLDCLNLDGTTLVNADTADFMQREDVRQLLGSDVGAHMIQHYGRKVADVISRRFIHRNAIESTFFSFPPTPDWASLGFGNVSIYDEKLDASTQQIFFELLEMVEDSDGPLKSEQVARLKSLIMKDPGILAQATSDELCSLFHHAAGDRRLVEWMIQMGALHFQPKHCRHRPAPGELRAIGMDDSMLINALAVHCAAKGGDVDMVRFLLEADHLRDLNTVTYHTRESLAHIAVKHGHRQVYDLLDALGADMRHKDASGKHISDYTTNSSWKRKILELVNAQGGQESKLRNHRNREPQFRREAETNARQLRRELEAQREMEHAEQRGSSTRQRFGSNRPRVPDTSALALPTTPANNAQQEPATANASNGKKKKKNKKKKGGQTSGPQSPGDAAVNLIDQLVFNGEEFPEPDAESVVDGDRIEQMSRALEAFKEGSHASEDERVASAMRALVVIETPCHYEPIRHVQHVVGHVTCHALDASQAIFLLNKYHRQQPEPPLVPRPMLFEPHSPTNLTSPVAKLQQRAGTELAFTEFLTFAAHTARVLGACNRLPQAKEVLDLVERRLLKFKQRPVLFREYVSYFLVARQSVGIDRATTPLSREGRTTIGMVCPRPPGSQQIHITCVGYALWTSVIPSPYDSGRLCIVAFQNILSSRPDEKTSEQELVFIDGYVAAGADSFDAIQSMMELMKDAAIESRVHFQGSDLMLAVDGIELVGFEFSNKGIVPTSIQEG